MVPSKTLQLASVFMHHADALTTVANYDLYYYQLYCKIVSESKLSTRFIGLKVWQDDLYVDSSLYQG